MMEKLLFLSLFLNLILAYRSITQISQRGLQGVKRLIKSCLIHFGLYPDDRNYLIVNTPLVYMTKDKEINYLQANDNDVSGKKLPQTLVIKPDFYQFNGKSYGLIQEGLARLIQPEKNNEQRIIYHHDVAALMSSLAWLMVHGDCDDGLSYQQLMAKARHAKLMLTCESMARFACTFLQSLQIEARVIGTRTMEQYNTYDSGHYLIEVYRRDLKKWVLYDLDHDACFSYQGQLLSLREWLGCMTEDYQINFLSNDIRVAVANSHVNNFDLTFVNEGRLGNLKHWYKRIMQLSFIEEDGHYFCYSPIDENLKEQYPKGAFPALQIISKDEFVRKFYSPMSS